MIKLLAKLSSKLPPNPFNQAFIEIYTQPNLTLLEAATKQGKSSHQLKVKIIEAWKFLAANYPKDIKAIEDEIAKVYDAAPLKPNKPYITIDKLAVALGMHANGHKGYRKFLKDFIAHANLTSFELMNYRVGKYAVIRVNIAVDDPASGSKAKPLKNMMLIRKICKALDATRESDLHTQLSSILLECGLNGEIAALRLGAHGEPSRLLQDVATMYELTRERIRQITQSVCASIAQAEAIKGFGPFTTVRAAFHQSKIEGSGRVMLMSTFLKKYGLERLDIISAQCMFNSMSLPYAKNRGNLYVVDSCLMADELQAIFRKPTNKVTKQILTKVPKEIIEQLDQVKINTRVLTGPTSRGDLISRVILSENLSTIQPMQVDWENDTSICLLLTEEAVAKLKQHCESKSFKGKGSRTGLLSAIIRHIVDSGASLQMAA